MPDNVYDVLIGAREAVEEIRKGRILIVIDDEDRENEGDFLMAAEKVTPGAVNFMVTHGRGLLCQCITRRRAEELELPLMAGTNTSLHATAFTVSVDAKEGTTTGISAADRAETIRVLSDPQSVPGDLLRPGHIFPLTAHPEGLLERDGHTEAAVELAELAGLTPSGIICEIMDTDGSMARLPRLADLAREQDLKIVTIRSLIDYLASEKKKEKAYA
jgi:3,4-dihydroxy 2-butanone 4-phosphate synthase/GTP cyclohydrolase II